MSVTAERKKEVITQYATGEKDTGSPEVKWLCSPSASPT
jgi:ribosomal protein S15P/S13E